MAAKDIGKFDDKLYQEHEQDVIRVEQSPGWKVMVAFMDKTCEDLNNSVMDDINPESYEKKFSILDIKKTQRRAWKDMKAIFDIMRTYAGKNEIVKQDKKLAKESETDLKQLPGGLKTSIQALAETFGVPKPPAV